MSLTHTVGYDGIVWTRIVSGKLTAKHTNDIELPDVRTSVRQFAAQQSTLRLKQPDYALAEEEARDDANAAATAAAATADDDATDASSNPKKRKRPASAGIVSSAIASTSAATASDSSFSFLQKTRLHLIIDDASQLHSLNPHNPVLQSYDIISVVAATEKLFHACCGHESVDIITIESARKMHFYLKKPAMKSVCMCALLSACIDANLLTLLFLLLSLLRCLSVALERGIYFEFNFAPALRGESTVAGGEKLQEQANSTLTMFTRSAFVFICRSDDPSLSIQQSSVIRARESRAQFGPQQRREQRDRAARTMGCD